MKRLVEVCKKLKTEDFILLNHLYLYRTLTITQIKHYIYHLSANKNKDKYKWAAILRRLQKFGLVEKQASLLYDDVLFLTTHGVEIVKYIGEIPNEKYDDKKQTVVPGYYKASEIKVKDKFINHQVHLNQFMIDIQKILNYYRLPFQYFDERFANNYGTMRPDALLRFLNFDFFIEEDMATESNKQLQEKWLGYRSFINSNTFQAKDRTIIVLFICDNIKNPHKIQKRQELVRYTVGKILLNDFQRDFDIIIGSPTDIKQYLRHLIQLRLRLISDNIVNGLLEFANNHQLTLTYADKLLPYLNNTYFQYDIKKINSQGQLSLLDAYRKPALGYEFLVDTYNERNFSVLSKINNYQYFIQPFIQQFHYRLLYLIIVPNNLVADLFLDLKMWGLEDIDNIYYITPNRLQKHQPFYRSIFQFDTSGNQYHFNNQQLTHLVPENNIELLQQEQRLIEYQFHAKSS